MHIGPIFAATLGREDQEALDWRLISINGAHLPAMTWRDIITKPQSMSIESLRSERRARSRLGEHALIRFVITTACRCSICAADPPAPEIPAFNVLQGSFWHHIGESTDRLFLSTASLLFRRDQRVQACAPLPEKSTRAKSESVTPGTCTRRNFTS